MKKMNNKGFSLVELIVVIAIMAVLVGVLAPQFIKYVESSRRSTDISNAQNIQSAMLADIADGLISADSTNDSIAAGHPSTLGEAPVGKGSAHKGTGFTASYSISKGICNVYLGDDELTSGPVAESYKNNH